MAKANETLNKVRVVRALLKETNDSGQAKGVELTMVKKFVEDQRAVLESERIKLEMMLKDYEDVA